MQAIHHKDMQLKTADQISGVIERERDRLWRFILSRIPDRADAEDLLQDVFREYVEAYRFTEPIQHAGAWMLRVARNRITDWFRKKRPVALDDAMPAGPDRESWSLEELLPSPGGDPDAVFARGILIDELISAIDELPPLLREVFVAHEVDGRAFKEISLATGVSVNTLISRKHRATLQLRSRLQDFYNEFNQR